MHGLGVKPFRDITLDFTVVVAVVEDHIHFLMDLLHVQFQTVIVHVFASDDTVLDFLVEAVDIFGQDYVEIDDERVVLHEVSAECVQNIAEADATS